MESLCSGSILKIFNKSHAMWRCKKIPSGLLEVGENYIIMGCECQLTFVDSDSFIYFDESIL